MKPANPTPNHENKESSPNYELVSVVLVEPEVSANVGFTCRAMKNLGFRELRLVAPPRLDNEAALRTACHADDILSKANHFSSLQDALADHTDVVGFSARTSRISASPTPLIDWSASVATRPGGLHARKMALVFGPESTGLRVEHLALCRDVVKIPANPAYSSFNLSHAVAVVLYEITRNALREDCDKSEVRPETPATWEQLTQLNKSIDQAAQRSRFYNLGTPTHLPAELHRIFLRANPSERELQILLGLFGRILKELDTGS